MAAVDKLSIENLVLSKIKQHKENGFIIPRKFSEIEDFPFKCFDDLKEEISKGYARINIEHGANNGHGFNSRHILMTEVERKIGWLISFSIFLLGIFSATMTYFYSAWFIVGFLPLLLPIKILTKFNDRVTVNAAKKSELNFLLLYSIGEVSVTLRKPSFPCQAIADRLREEYLYLQKKYLYEKSKYIGTPDDEIIADTDEIEKIARELWNAELMLPGRHKKTIDKIPR